MPGSLATARDWQLVARALAPRMTTYALDRRGHGTSDDPEYSLEREQDDLAAVAGSRPQPTTRLELARRIPAGIPPGRLVLYEPPLALESLVGGPALDEYARAVSADDTDRALAIGLREFVGMPDDAIAVMRQQPIWVRLSGMTPGWTREIRALDEFVADLAGDLSWYGTISIPVLLLMGELSPPWLTAASRRLARSLPDVTVAELPGQAHDAHIFAATAVADQIARFAL